MSKNRASTLTIAASLLIVFGTGCAPTETGNPPNGSVQLGFTAFSSAPTVAALAEPGAGLVVDRAAVNVTSLSLLPCTTSSASLEVPAASYELVGASKTLELLGPERLCGLALELGPSESAGPAVFIHGTRAVGAPFEVLSFATTTVALQAKAGDEFGDQPLLLAFDLGVWFTQVDVHGAHAGADGVARLDAALNPDLLAAFEARASLSVTLYEDADGDGVLDDDEATPIAATP